MGLLILIDTYSRESRIGLLILIYTYSRESRIGLLIQYTNRHVL